MPPTAVGLVVTGLWGIIALVFADFTQGKIYPQWMLPPERTNAILIVFFALGFPASYFLGSGAARWLRGDYLPEYIARGAGVSDTARGVGVLASIIWSIVPLVLASVSPDYSREAVPRLVSHPRQHQPDSGRNDVNGLPSCLLLSGWDRGDSSRAY